LVDGQSSLCLSWNAGSGGTKTVNLSFTWEARPAPVNYGVAQGPWGYIPPGTVCNDLIVDAYHSFGSAGSVHSAAYGGSCVGYNFYASSTNDSETLVSSEVVTTQISW
jgi:hypothetical protein